MAERKSKLQPLVFGIVCIGMLVLLGLVVKSFMGKSDAPKKPPKISLIPTTPPPPPPPPKEEKKPEPPKEQKEVKMEQVEQKIAPPNPELKMEGQAGDGPSAFSAGKVTSEDLSKVGGGGGGLVNPFNTYAMSIKSELQRQLAKRSELKRRQYRIEVNLWVTDSGRVKNYELLGTTNDPDTDDAIRSVLASLPSFSEAPPPHMPQPIKLRLVANTRV